MNDTQSVCPKQSVSVLIIEDDFDSFIQIKRLLDDIGITEAQWKSSGMGAVQFADTLHPPPDLILLDIGLPGEDGYEILQRMRNTPQFRDTRIIAVTGRTTMDDIRRAQTAGFDGFLGKPLDIARFPDQIARILKGESVWERS